MPKVIENDFYEAPESNLLNKIKKIVVNEQDFKTSCLFKINVNVENGKNEQNGSFLFQFFR